MALGYLVALRNSQLDEIIALMDAGTGAAKLRFYDSTRPTTGGTVTTLLAELTFTDPAAAAAAAGLLTMSAITADADANATGTATWFRIVDSDNTFVLDGDIGTSGSDLNVNTTTVTTGVNVAVTSFTITAGNT